MDVSEADADVITKFVPALFELTHRPCGFATVPKAWQVRKIIELAVTAVVATVAVPATRATVPKLFAPAEVVEPTFALKSLLPADTKFRLPVILTFPVPARILTAVAPVVLPIVVVDADAPDAILTA